MCGVSTFSETRTNHKHGQYTKARQQPRRARHLEGFALSDIIEEEIAALVSNFKEERVGRARSLRQRSCRKEQSQERAQQKALF